MDIEDIIVDRQYILSHIDVDDDETAPDSLVSLLGFMVKVKSIQKGNTVPISLYETEEPVKASELVECICDWDN